ncbi:putative RNA-directed DNA polymerase [Helianthus annuus]|nr:putative RNA-directed DNA polymerase [Helianthus annuus]
MTWIYFLKHKYEVFSKFTIFYTMVQTQFKTNIQILRSDNGGEFINDSMKQFCQTKGIIHQTSCPHTPEQNGTVERKNRILLEMARALLIESSVPKSFWPEALATATYLLNRLPTKALDLKTPIQTLSTFSKLPPPLTLQPRIFGCSVFPHIPKINRGKLGPCTEKCVFLGYGPHQKGYRCYSPRRRHMYITLDCDLLEIEFFYTSQHSVQGETENSDTLSWLKWTPFQERNRITHNESLASHNPNGNIGPTSVTNQDPPGLVTEVSNSHTHEDSQNIESNDHRDIDNHDIEQILQEEQEEQVQGEHGMPIQEETTDKYVLSPRANRGIPPKRYTPEKQANSSRYPMANIAKGNLSKEAKEFACSLYDDQIPNSVKQALDSKNWKDAMETEMEALIKNNTWEKCVLPPGKKAVGC